MKILATSTDISPDDAATALMSVLAPKTKTKVKTYTKVTTIDAKTGEAKVEEVEDEEELVNDEETTRNIMNSAIDMTDNIMKGWKDGTATFEIGDLSKMLEATFAIKGEYAAVTKFRARTYVKGSATDATTVDATTTDATKADATTVDATTTDATVVDATKTDEAAVEKVSDYENEKGK